MTKTVPRSGNRKGVDCGLSDCSGADETELVQVDLVGHDKIPGFAERDDIECPRLAAVASTLAEVIREDAAKEESATPTTAASNAAAAPPGTRHPGYRRRRRSSRGSRP